MDFSRSAGYVRNLTASGLPDEEIVERAEKISLALRGSNIFAPALDLLSRKDKIEALDLPSISIATSAQKADLYRDVELTQAIALSLSHGVPEFQLYYKRSCIESVVNLRVTRLLGNCLLNTKYASLPDGEYLFDAEFDHEEPDRISASVKKEANLFSRALRYPHSIVENCLNGNGLGRARLANLLGGDVGEMTSYRLSRGHVDKVAPEPV